MFLFSLVLKLENICVVDWLHKALILFPSYFFLFFAYAIRILKDEVMNVTSPKLQAYSNLFIFVFHAYIHTHNYIYMQVDICMCIHVCLPVYVCILYLFRTSIDIIIMCVCVCVSLPHTVSPKKTHGPYFLNNLFSSKTYLGTWHVVSGQQMLHWSLVQCVVLSQLFTNCYQLY